MGKKITFRSEARERILEGATQITDAVRHSGLRVVIRSLKAIGSIGSLRVDTKACASARDPDSRISFARTRL